jgi:hypothetical protein
MEADLELDIKRCSKCNRSFAEKEGDDTSEVCGTCKKKNKPM